MRLALPPCEETCLAPGACQGYAVRPGTVLVCRAGRVELVLGAPGLLELPGEIRLVLGAGETFVVEDRGWLRCTALAPARVLCVPPHALRRAGPGRFSPWRRLRMALDRL